MCIRDSFTERQFSIDYRLLEPVGSYIHKEERQHTGVDMYRNVDTHVTRRWLAYLVPADLSDLLCHTGRHGISSSLKLTHQTPDNILLSFRVCDGQYLQCLYVRDIYLIYGTITCYLKWTECELVGR